MDVIYIYVYLSGYVVAYLCDKFLIGEDGPITWSIIWKRAGISLCSWLLVGVMVIIIMCYFLNEMIKHIKPKVLAIKPPKWL